TRLHRHLVLDATGELDAEQEAAEHHGQHADPDQDPGGQVPLLAPPDEVDVGLAPVEAAEHAARSCRHGQDSFVRTAPKRGDLAPAEAAASRALSERTLPSPENLGEVNVLDLESSATSGWVNRKTTSRSITVDRPKVNAKPFT